ncbi:MAG: VWA domain-containing protein [Pyrinomonadaceae bacterium]
MKLAAFASLLLLPALAAARSFPARRQTPSTPGAQEAAQKPTPKATPTATPTGGQGDEDALRVETTLVTVPASVLERGGRYVPDLTREDFRVFEDGVEQRVAHFAPVEAALTVALLIDTSDSLRFRLEDVRRAALAFLDQLRAGDRVMIVTFDSQINILCEPTEDHDKARRAVAAAGTAGGTRLYDALDFVIRQRLGGARTGRKAVVLFTDGADTGSFQATPKSTLWRRWSRTRSSTPWSTRRSATRRGGCARRTTPRRGPGRARS